MLGVIVIAAAGLGVLPVLGQEQGHQPDQAPGQGRGSVAAAAEPVFLEFAPSSDNGWDDQEEYVVPEGKRLRVEFVGFQMSGTSISAGNLHTSVMLEVSFREGEGGSCNRPDDDGTCDLRVPVIPLNNTEFGANVSFQFPTTAAPVSLEAPAGATISARLASGNADFGGPGDDPFRTIRVTVAGQLIDVP